MAVITVRDEKGSVLGTIGRRVAGEDLYNVNPEPHGSDSTLRLQTPAV